MCSSLVQSLMVCEATGNSSIVSWFHHLGPHSLRPRTTRDPLSPCHPPELFLCLLHVEDDGPLSATGARRKLGPLVDLLDLLEMISSGTSVELVNAPGQCSTHFWALRLHGVCVKVLLQLVLLLTCRLAAGFVRGDVWVHVREVDLRERQSTKPHGRARVLTTCAFLITSTCIRMYIYT